MATKHGMQTRVFVNTTEFSEILSNVTISLSNALADSSQYKPGFTYAQRVSGLADGKLTLEGCWEDANVTGPFALFTGTGSCLAYVAIGDTNVIQQNLKPGSRGYAFAGRFDSYEVSAPVGDIVKHSMTITGGSDQDCIPENVLFVASAVYGGSTTSMVYDTAETTAGGGSVWFMAFPNITSASTTIDVYHSSDNFVSDSTLLCSFADVVSTATKSQRVEVSGAMKRYFKFTLTPTAGLVQANFAIHRN